MVTLPSFECILVGSLNFSARNIGFWIDLTGYQVVVPVHIRKRIRKGSAFIAFASIGIFNGAPST